MLSLFILLYIFIKTMTEKLKPVDYQLAQARRLELREELALIPELLEKPPKQWVPLFVRQITRLRRNLDAFAPETQAYLKPALHCAIQSIRQEQDYTNTHPDDKLLSPLSIDPQTLSPKDREKWEKAYLHMRGIRADHLIMNYSRMMAESFGQELLPVQEVIVPIKEIIDSNPNISRLETDYIDGHEIKVAYFKHPNLNIWQRVPLPFDQFTAIKGGGARIINGFYAGAPDSMMAAEIPQNDTDLVMAMSDENGEDLERYWSVADILGADHSGVEFKSGSKLDFPDYANSRDMTINMAWITEEGLHTCPQAIDAARTGIVEVTGNYRPDKAIYNTDRFTYNDSSTGETIVIPKQRGISRLVKATAEGKVLGFKYMDISANTPLSIYALWLVKRWHKYADPKHPQHNPQLFGDLLEKMFYLAKNMGQLPTGVNNVIEYLDSVHANSPYFDFQKDIKDMIDIDRWKGKRLAKQLDREYAWTTGISGNFDFVRRPEDTVPRLITLSDYHSNKNTINQTISDYPSFRSRCDQRSKSYNQLNIKPSQKYFFLDLDIETTPNGEDI